MSISTQFLSKALFRSGWVLISITLLGVLTHSLPHNMGFSSVGAVGMLAAAYLPRRWVLVPVLTTILVVDAVQGFYGWLAMSFVYLAHLTATYAVRPTLRSVVPTNVLLASVISAGLFYLISHITPMMMGYYPATFEGWLTCYINGLPFLARGIAANVVLGGLFFGLIWVFKVYGSNRIAATERH